MRAALSTMQNRTQVHASAARCWGQEWVKERLSKYLTDCCCRFFSGGLVLYCTEKLVTLDWAEVVTLKQALVLQARSSASSKIRSGVVLTLLLTDLSFTASRCSGQFSDVGLISGIWGKKLGEESIIHFRSNETTFLWAIFSWGETVQGNDRCGRISFFVFSRVLLHSPYIRGIFFKGCWPNSWFCNLEHLYIQDIRHPLIWQADAVR